MKYSFTGTQVGMTKNQKLSFVRLLSKFSEWDYLVHGDCVGADEDANNIAVSLGHGTSIRPCNILNKRAYCKSETIYPVKPSLDRNRDIVDEGEVLVATPKGFDEEIRSGTWYTVRYARKRERKIFIIWPNGDVSLHGFGLVKFQVFGPI